MTRITASLATLLVATCAALGQETIFHWSLDQPAMEHWRKKANCTLAHVPAERGGVLKWTATFGEFSFGWTTFFAPKKLDFTPAGRITFWVKGDGSGHRLTLQLGVTDPGKRSTYYVNNRDGVALDFTGWREVSFAMQRFEPPRGRDPNADMAQVAFVEFFLNRKGPSAGADLMLDDVRVHPAAPEQAKAIAKMWDMFASVAKPQAATDGSNMIANPSFELDINSDAQPDFWPSGDWGTGSRVAWDTSVAHTGKASVRVDCASDKQRGSFSFRPPVGPGCWLFEAWYRTAGVESRRGKGVDARLIAVSDKGKQCGVFHAYGEPSEGQWAKATVAFDLPPQAKHINLDLFNFFAAGTVWWDDVSLRYDVKLAKQRVEQRRIESERTKEAVAMIDEIQKKVQALSADTPAHKLKKGALTWAVEDAQAAIDAGLGTSAKGLLADVEPALAKAIGQRHEPPRELMLPVPKFADNPYAQGLLGRVRSALRDKTLYKKGDEGYQQIGNAWSFSGLGNNCYVAAWALCHPDSPYAADPDLLVRILRIMQAVFQNHKDGDFNPGREAVHGYDPNINRFCFVPTFEAYLLLRAAYPDLLFPSKRREWEESARVATEFQVETYGVRASNEPPHCYYANMDVHYMLMLELAARIFDEPRYHEQAERFLKLTVDVLYPDGAFSYIARQNECYVYHQINVAHLARYWQLTGDKLALDTVVKSRPYYPYNVEPGGVPEYYTDCFWKHYWGGASPIGPEIVAGLTGCPHNKRVANCELKWAKPNSYYAIYAATVYRDFPDEPLPDNYIMYDRNVEGPRGRFGRFSFAGTTRFLGKGCQGKDTFVGCMAVDEPDRRFPLNAALQVVTNQYRLQPDGQRWRTCRFLSQEEKNGVTIAKNFAALTTRYRIQNVAWGGGSTLTDWAGNQQWILTPHRLVGVLEIETLSDQKAYSIHGRIRFGLNKAIERKDDTFFKYGALLCRLHEHSYADVITEKSETFYIDKPEKFRSTEIVLRDARSIESKGQTQLTYPKGTRHFFTVEVLPYWSSPAEAVKRVTTPSGLRGLEVCADGRRLLLIHNPTDTAATYAATQPWARGALVVHNSGNHAPAPRAIDAGDRGPQLTVPPDGHVVLEKVK